MEEHVCVNHCHLFNKVAQRDWRFHIDDQCPHCHEPRFKVVSCGQGRRPRLLPRQRFWHLGLEYVIRDQCFADSRWCQLRKQSSSIDKHGFRASPAFRSLCARISALYNVPDMSGDDKYGLWTIGFDFYQPFRFKSHSVGAVGIRCVQSLLVTTACESLKPKRALLDASSSPPP